MPVFTIAFNAPTAESPEPTTTTFTGISYFGSSSDNDFEILEI